MEPTGTLSEGKSGLTGDTDDYKHLLVLGSEIRDVLRTMRSQLFLLRGTKILCQTKKADVLCGGKVNFFTHAIVSNPFLYAFQICSVCANKNVVKTTNQ